MASSSLAAGIGSGSSAWPSLQSPPADQPVDYLSATPSTASTTSPMVRSVPAVMNYVSPDTVEISTRRDLGGSDSTLVGAIWQPTVVRVANARIGSLSDGGTELTLDRNGFELRSSSEVEELVRLDFCHQDEVVNKYYPLCESLVADAFHSQQSIVDGTSSPSITGVFAFDHNVRSSDRTTVGTIKGTAKGEEEKTTSAAAPQVQNPAGLVHADYTRISAPRRFLDLSNPPKLNDVLRPKLLAQKKNSLLDPTVVNEALEGKRRYAFVNVWRSIDTVNPVKNTPLACVDASTASMNDLRTFKIHYIDRVGENYFVCPSSSTQQQHEWYYYPDMTIKEALLLKQWDSKGEIANGAEIDSDGSPSTFTIHSAFCDPSCPENAPPRKSIEVRCVVIWEQDGV